MKAKEEVTEQNGRHKEGVVGTGRHTLRDGSLGDRVMFGAKEEGRRKTVSKSRHEPESTGAGELPLHTVRR